MAIQTEGVTLAQIDGALETFRNPRLERNHWWYVHLDKLLDVRQQLADAEREGRLPGARESRA